METSFEGSCQDGLGGLHLIGCSACHLPSSQTTHFCLQVASPEFRGYCEQVVANSKALAFCLSEEGCKLVTGGTDNHLLLWDLKSEGLSGAKMEKVCEEASIIVQLGCQT